MRKLVTNHTCWWGFCWQQDWEHSLCWQVIPHPGKSGHAVKPDGDGGALNETAAPQQPGLHSG